MSVSFMSLGTADELRAQIIDVALDRAFLLDPLPTERSSTFKKRRLEEGRSGRLTLIANEVARLAGDDPCRIRRCRVRKVKDTKNQARVGAGLAIYSSNYRSLIAQALPGRCTPWTQLQHLAALPEGDSCCVWTSCAPMQRAMRCEAGRAPSAGAALLATRRRSQRRGRRSHERISLAAGGVAGELLRAGVAHAAAGEREAARQGLGAAAGLTVLSTFQRKSPLPRASSEEAFASS